MWCSLGRYTGYYFLTNVFFFSTVMPLTFIRQFGHFAWISVRRCGCSMNANTNSGTTHLFSCCLTANDLPAAPLTRVCKAHGGAAPQCAHETHQNQSTTKTSPKHHHHHNHQRQQRQVLSIASIGGVVLLVIIHGPGTGAEILDNFAALVHENCSATDLLAANETVRLFARSIALSPAARGWRCLW